MSNKPKISYKYTLDIKKNSYHDISKYLPMLKQEISAIINNEAIRNKRKEISKIMSNYWREYGFVCKCTLYETNSKYNKTKIYKI